MKKWVYFLIIMFLFLSLFGLTTVIIISLCLNKYGNVDFKLISINLFSIEGGVFIGAITMFLDKNINEEKNK